MASASDFVEKRTLDFWLKNNSESTSSPSAVHVALFTADPTDSAGLTNFENEVSTSGTNYSRKQVTFGTIDSTGGSVSNSGNVTFDAATSSFGTVTHIGICDGATAGAGQLLFHGALDASKAIGTGDTFQITAGNLTVTMA